MNYSKTYAAFAAIALAYVGQRFGLDIDAKDPEIMQAFMDVAALVALVTGIVERYRKGGVKWHGGKK